MYVSEVGFDLAVDQLERHAGQKDAVEKPFQHGGITEIPDWEGENERVGGSMPRDIVRDGFDVRPLVVVTPALEVRKDRVEALGVEVAIVDLPAALGERFDDAGVERGSEAVAAGVSVEDKGPGHSAA